MNKIVTERLENIIDVCWKVNWINNLLNLACDPQSLPKTANIICNGRSLDYI